MRSRPLKNRRHRTARTNQMLATVVERLEVRRLFFDTGGQWANPDELDFSYVNVFDGGIQDGAGNPLSDASIRSAIIEGMSVWAGVAPLKFHQVPDSGPNPPNDIAYFLFDSRLRFGHHNDDGVGNDLAHAWLPDAGSSLAGDVHFDNSEPWSTSPTNGTDLIETAAHEVGHALGMKHDNTFNALMNTNYAGRYSGPGTAFLLADDVNGIQSMYGTGLGYVLTDADRLFVSGTGNADEITVDYDNVSDELIVTSVGIGSFRIDEDEVLEIVVDARGGNDVVRIQRLPTDTTAVVNGGLGNDTINVGDTDFNSNIESNVTVNGDAGTDRLIVRDGEDDVGNDIYDITPTSLSKPGSVLLSWTVGDTEELEVVGSANDDTFNLSGNSGTAADLLFELKGNDGADMFNINEVDDRADVFLLGGGSHDVFNVGNGDYDTNIDGDVDVDGGDSGDILTVDDTVDVGNDEYVLDAGRFERPTGSDGILTYSNVSTFNLDANGDANEINVIGVASGVTTNVDGRGGDDTFNVGDYDYDTNILGTLTIVGGNVGTTDFLRIRDSNDAGNDDYFFAESATFGNYFDKDSSGLLIYSELEEIHLLANNAANDVYVSDTPSGTDVTLYGQSGNDNFYVGTTDLAVAGDLDPIDGALVIWAGTGTDTVTYDDSGDTVGGIGALPDHYRVSDTTVVKVVAPNFTQELEYHEMEALTLEANADGSSITVYGTHASTPVTLLGNDGNDTFRIGENDNVAGIDGAVEATGGNGTDALFYNDAASTGDHAYTVGPNEISRTNVAGTDPGVESVTVNAGLGANVITVPSNNQPTTINGGAGDDTFLVGTGLWDAAIQSPVTVNGDAGTDGLVIDDSNDVGADGYNVTATQTTKNVAFAGAVNYGTIESYELAANSLANVIQVNGTIDGDVLLRGRGGADDFDVIDHAAGRAITIEDGPDLDQVRVNSDGVGSANVQFQTDLDLALLNIGPNSTATLLANGDRSIYTQALGMTSTSKLDLADNDMILDYTGASPMPAVIAALTAGYNGGGWNGASGIVSSVAALGTSNGIGYAEATDLFTAFPATFAGVSVDNTSILMKYTYNGDTNLDGNVNLADFNKLAANFGQSPRRWVHGNSDFNGNVNLADFNKLAANFGGTGLLPPDMLPGGGEEEVPAKLEDLVRPGSAPAGSRGQASAR